MLQDKDFADLIHMRYFDLRKNILSIEAIGNTIDSVAALLNEAQSRHFQRWNILGVNTGTPESGYQPDTYQGVIAQFKSWISTRLEWLDTNMIGSIVSVEENSDFQSHLKLYPNPVRNIFFVESDKEIYSVRVSDIAGIKVKETIRVCNFSLSIDMTGLNPGIYFLQVTYSNGEIAFSKIVKK